MKLANVVGLISLSSLWSVACGPSLGSMHELARAGQVQAAAKLHSRQSIVIEAPCDRVYALVTDVGGWPSWQPTVSQVQASAAAPGARFTWKNGSSTISSQFAAVRPNELVSWTGSVSIAKAIHVWRFTPLTDSSTEVTVEETMDGFLLTWFYRQHQLDAEVACSLTNLRAAAERR